ncbi:MAG: UbiH/UbiF family hydroxylase [Sphingobacteriales bacterium]|jgi:2-octaprenyl-6-methoxyphenol hydroxylase
MPDKYRPNSEVIVVGGGPVGLTAAVTLAEGGVATKLAGKRPTSTDNRTTALLAGSVTALETLGVWQSRSDRAAPLRTMRIVDDTGRLWRAPEIKFDSTEIGLDAFGYNIENRFLVEALEQRARSLPKLQIIEKEVVSVEPQSDCIAVKLKDGETFGAQLVIGADGRHSICRAAAAIKMDERRYPQVALTLCLTHTRPHHDTSTEFHTPSGPFTLVPLPGNRSSLVWVLDSTAADELAVLDSEALALEVERGSHSILGKIEVEPNRGLFPLSVATVRRFADRRISLAGEAAHVIPPIGAQGLNLGLRDAATIGELVVSAQRKGRDIGAADVLTRYDQMRRADVGSRTLAIDFLNRTLLSDFLPVQGARGLGLYLLDRIGPLRRAVMREGVAPAAAQPRLMRGEAL